jgi:hypothetical protein
VKSHHVDCECRSCALMRVVYALIVAREREDIQRKDFEWAILTLSHAETMEGIN